jgi:D-alanine transaminase
MTRVAYVNGRYLPHHAAAVHIEDRGYQFADGVYEVVAVQGGRLVDGDGHLDRLDRSLGELRIAPPMTRRSLEAVMNEVIRRNRIDRGSIYLQMTRAVAARDHPFPRRGETQVVMTAKRVPPPSPSVADDGVKVITIPDIRWERCDIKTVALLANVLAKQQAREAGAYEAFLVDADGAVTEGSSTNAWIITKDGTVVTRPASNAILDGITRRRVIQLARAAGFKVEERSFTVGELKAAREVFLTSTTSYVTPVSQVDDTVIGNGKPGSLSLDLRARYIAFMERHAAA